MTVDMNGNCDNDISDRQLAGQARSVLRDAFRGADATPGAARRAEAKTKRFEARTKAERAGKLTSLGQKIINANSGTAAGMQGLSHALAGAYMFGGCFGYTRRQIREGEDLYRQLSSKYNAATAPARKCFAEAAQYRKEARRLKFGAAKDSTIGALQAAAYKVGRMFGMK